MSPRRSVVRRVRGTSSSRACVFLLNTRPSSVAASSTSDFGRCVERSRTTSLKWYGPGSTRAHGGPGVAQPTPVCRRDLHRPEERRAPTRNPPPSTSAAGRRSTRLRRRRADRGAGGGGIGHRGDIGGVRCRHRRHDGRRESMEPGAEKLPVPARTSMTSRADRRATTRAARRKVSRSGGDGRWRRGWRRRRVDLIEQAPDAVDLLVTSSDERGERVAKLGRVHAIPVREQIGQRPCTRAGRCRTPWHGAHRERRRTEEGLCCGTQPNWRAEHGAVLLGLDEGARERQFGKTACCRAPRRRCRTRAAPGPTQSAPPSTAAFRSRAAGEAARIERSPPRISRCCRSRWPRRSRRIACRRSPDGKSSRWKIQRRRNGSGS